ncbi:MAG: LON peptidase substrate-binding domain-containing protein [Bdellovibrionales bacterium]
MTGPETTSSAITPSALPEILPIFPLSGVLLLPRGRLPLNIFEPRYLEMVEHALGHGRLIGMVQPSVAEGPEPFPPVYHVGCAGRITSFSETEDGRFLINLTGTCRFRITEELPMERGFRRVKPNWEKFLNDLGAPDEAEIDREKLLGVLRGYFKQHSIAADWNAVQNTNNETLVSSLAMICPLASNEKQALLEADDLSARADLLMALLEMASMPQAEVETAARH